jgi:hypothetical protein
MLRARAGAIAGEFVMFAKRTSFNGAIRDAHLLAHRLKMQRLQSRWERRLEAEAKVCEHGERIENLRSQSPSGDSSAIFSLQPKSFQPPAVKPVVVPSETKLPLRLERGKDCEELAKEIAAIKHKRKHGGLTVAEIQSDCSMFKIWKRVEVLSSEDKDAFLHPSIWEPGYANLLLGKLYATTRRSVAPGTINTWRKEYREYLKWQQKNPSKTAEDFGLELQRRKRGYRK